VTNMNMEGDFILVDIRVLCIIYWILNLCERICKFRVKLKYYKFTLMSTHAPAEEKDEITKCKNFIFRWRRYVMQFLITT
jgi:hypothetical protein